MIVVRSAGGHREPQLRRRVDARLRGVPGGAGAGNVLLVQPGAIHEPRARGVLQHTQGTNLVLEEFYNTLKV